MGGKRHKSFSVTIDASDLDKLRYRLADMEKRAPSVMANALNQTLTVMKKYIPKQLRKEYTYKRKLQNPTAVRAKYSNLRAYLKYHPTPFEEIKKIGKTTYKDFDHREGTPGRYGDKFKARVRFDEGWNEKDRVFTAKGTVFRRKRGAERYPIFYAMGPSEHTMVRHVWRGEEAQQDIGKVLSQKLDEQIDKAFLKKWKRKWDGK